MNTTAAHAPDEGERDSMIDREMIAEARRRLKASRLGLSLTRETDKDLIVMRALADRLEAASLNPEPSEAEVEAGCAAFYEDARGITSWARLVDGDPDLANRYRDGIRAALTAARNARERGDHG